MAPVTQFDGRTTAVNVAANTQVVLVPAIADATLAAITKAEYDAGEAIETSIKTVNITGSVATQTEQYLSDSDVSQTTGATTWSADPFDLVAGDPQTPNTWLAGLTEGQVVYVVQRRGLPHATESAAGQKVSIARCEITLIEDGPATANADGDKYHVLIHVAVKQFERKAAISA